MLVSNVQIIWTNHESFKRNLYGLSLIYGIHVADMVGVCRMTVHVTFGCHPLLNYRNAHIQQFETITDFIVHHVHDTVTLDKLKSLWQSTALAYCCGRSCVLFLGIQLWLFDVMFLIFNNTRAWTLHLLMLLLLSLLLFLYWKEDASFCIY